MSSPIQGRSDNPHHTDRRQLAVQQVVKEIGTISYPTLTRTNYSDWAVLMRVNLQAHGLWDAVNTGDVSYQEDRMALSVILRAVPSEMIRPLAEKDNAKEAWIALQSMRVGAERVRESKAQKLRQRFESMRFKDGETVEDFSLRLQGVVSDLRLLGEDVSEEKVVRKLLRVVPRKYRQIALSIETLVDLRALSIEDLTGRLHSVEDREESDDEGGEQLLFTKKDWATRTKQDSGDSSLRTINKEGAHSRQRGRDVSEDKCYYCDKQGHWARDCRKAKRDREKLIQANLLRTELKSMPKEEEALLTMEDEEPALL